MKKFTYLLAAAVLGLASCGPKNYTITGTMEDAVDGDTLFLMKRENRQFVPVDTAVIAEGKFVFTGVQDSAVNRYLVYIGEDDLQPTYLDLFVENGEINVQMTRTPGTDVVSGTPTNDAYFAFTKKVNAVSTKQDALYKKMSADATEEDKKSRMEEMKALDEELISVIKEGVNQNISTPLGVFLLNAYNYYLEYSDVGQLLSAVPAHLQGDERVVRLKAQVETAAKTAVGQKFVDLEMKDTEGNPVKLSDYAGKGKLVLVDFWASWCGPCRREMPKLVEAYAKYKDKNFEIVGVSFDRDAEPWKKGLEQMEMTWPQMSDLKYWESEGAKVYAVRSIPHVMLIDGDGTIISRGLHGEVLYAKLAELMP